MDVLICGMCSKRFETLTAFVKHKKASQIISCRSSRTSNRAEDNETQHFQENEVVQIQTGKVSGTCSNVFQSHSLKSSERQHSESDLADQQETRSTGVSEKNLLNDALKCQKCSRVFRRERHLRSHYCMRHGSKKTQSCDLREDLDDEVDNDTSPDFQIRTTTGGPPRTKRTLRSTLKNSSGESHSTGLASSEGPVGSKESEVEPISDTCALPDTSSPLPVFNTEDEKLSFQDHLKAVDLACMAKMYTKHMVNQELASYDISLKPKRSRSAKELSIFSCNTCKKVFHSESHMRVHCLSHTSLKPFSCLECDFSSNSKGSLQTHMRTHTGNIFACDTCPFKTGNAGHLREHKETHSAVGVKCKLCRHLYKTKKSLRNHVLRYHRSSAGKKYLSSFRSQSQCSMATLHLCQICNKKFKKKSDRDHHQSSHNAHAQQEPEHNARQDETTNIVVIQEPLRNQVIEKSYNAHKEVPLSIQQLPPPEEHTHLSGKETSSPELVIKFSNEWLGDNSHPPTQNLATHSLCGQQVLSNGSGTAEPECSSSTLDEEISRRNNSSNECEMDAIETAIFSANLESLFEREVGEKSSYLNVEGKEVQSSLQPSCEYENSSHQPDVDACDTGSVEKESKQMTSCNQNKERVVYQCPECHRSFKRSSKDLERHMQIHRRNISGPVKIHPKTTEPEETVPESWLCRSCGSSFQDQGTWNEHSRLHTTPPLASDEAPISLGIVKEPVSMPRAEQVQREPGEKSVEESGQPTYSCLGCGTTYLSFWDIHVHLKDKHGILLDVADSVGTETPLQDQLVTTSSG